MPEWLTALLVLIILCGVGAYMIEGFFDTAESACNTTYTTCISACSGSSYATCFKKCMDAKTTCSQKAVAAASVDITGNLQKSYKDANLAWAAQQDSSLLGTSTSSTFNIDWANNPTGSASNTLFSASLSNIFGDYSSSPSYSSSSSSSSHSPSPSPSSHSPSSHSPSSDWNANRDKQISGWKKQSHDLLQTDDSYDDSMPLEGSYVVQVKKWKPHETPTEEPKGVTIDAPTDEGTLASEITASTSFASSASAYPSASLQQMIREDVKYTVDSIFKNQYEIQYS